MSFDLPALTCCRLQKGLKVATNRLQLEKGAPDIQARNRIIDLGLHHKPLCLCHIVDRRDRPALYRAVPAKTCLRG